MNITNTSRMIRIIIVAMLFSTVIFVDNFFGAWLSPCKNSDECGKVVGWIIDADTNEVVKEDFAISLFPYYTGPEDRPRDYYVVRTITGNFSLRVLAGKYIVVFTPYSGQTKYPSFFDPNDPGRNNEENQITIVEKGKITEIKKKVSEGGSLKIILIDNNGGRLNFREHFNKGIVYVHLKNVNMNSSKFIAMNEEQMRKGELKISGLFAGTYQIGAKFDLAGYRTNKIELIVIERKKETLWQAKINPFDNTGIHGFVKNKNGEGIKNADVTVYQVKGDREFYYANYSTGTNGYYKLIGLDEGTYNLRVEVEFEPIDILNIAVTENKLSSRDIQVK